MGRLGAHAVYASPVQSPARTQDSLPVVGQTLPGGLDDPLGSSERFRAVSYISPPFPGLPWRKRAPVRHAVALPSNSGRRFLTARRAAPFHLRPEGVRRAAVGPPAVIAWRARRDLRPSTSRGRMAGEAIA